MEDVGALLALAVAAGVVRTLTRRRAPRALSLPRYLPPRPPRESDMPRDGDRLFHGLAHPPAPPPPPPPPRVSEMPRDGNCLFHGLAHPCAGTHALIRRGIVRHVVDNWDRFAPFLPDETAESYAARMRADGEWGGEVELRAFADLARVRVHVLEAHWPHRTIACYGTGGGAAKRLLFDGSHYDVCE